MIRPVIVYPNKFLRKVSEAYAIGELTSPEFTELVRDLRDTVIAAGGAAISAPQIGVSKRLIVLHPVLADEAKSDVLINPILHKIADTKREVVEGCLSFPGVEVTVKRSDTIEVSAHGLTGEHITFDCSGDLSQALEHELEHLDGVLLIDHAKPVKKEMINRRTAKHAGEAVWYGKRQ